MNANPCEPQYTFPAQITPADIELMRVELKRRALLIELGECEPPPRTPEADAMTEEILRLQERLLERQRSSAASHPWLSSDADDNKLEGGDE